MGIEANLYCSRHGSVTKENSYIDANGTLRCNFCKLPTPELSKPISKSAKKAAKLLSAANHENTLDPGDPFDSVILKMVEVNRAKRRDYALDGEFDSNFTDVAFNLGIDDFGNVESAYVLLLTKVARIRSLRKNGRMEDPSNESVVDTFVDLANYAVLCLAMIQEKQSGN